MCSAARPWWVIHPSQLTLSPPLQPTSFPVPTLFIIPSTSPSLLQPSHSHYNHTPSLAAADINAQTEETQETPLTLACCGGFLEVADFLIKSGADIELGCSTPLMEASQEGHLELVKYLLNCGQWCSVVVWWCG